MGALGVVGDEPFVEDGLHLVDGLEPRPSAFDAEVLIEHGGVEAFDDAVGLRLPDLGGPVFDLLKLKDGRTKSGPGVAGMAVNGQLHVDFADPLEGAG